MPTIGNTKYLAIYLKVGKPSMTLQVSGFFFGGIMKELEIVKKHIDSLESENRHLVNLLYKVQKVHSPVCGHYCKDWNGVYINEFNGEFENCTCFPEANGD